STANNDRQQQFANIKLESPLNARATHGDTLVMRSSLGSDEGQGAKVQPSYATTDAVLAACPIGQHNGVIHGHSRVHGHTARPAFELTDTPGPEAFQAGHAGPIPVARSAGRLADSERFRVVWVEGWASSGPDGFVRTLPASWPRASAMALSLSRVACW